MCFQNTINISIQFFLAVHPADRCSFGKSCMFHIFLRTIPGNSNPHIRPGILPVCLIPGFHIRAEQKRITCSQYIFLIMNLQCSPAAPDNMQYIRGTHIRTISVTGITIFPATVAQTQVCRILLQIFQSTESGRIGIT